MDFQTTIDKFGSLFLQHFIAIREKKISNSNFLHLLYLECKHNLAILDAVALDQSEKKCDDTSSNKTFLRVASYLQTGVMEHILSDSNRFTALLNIDHRLESPVEQDMKQQPATPGKQETETKNKKQGTDSIKHHLLSVYSKIVSLRTIATMDEADEHLRSIRYQVRLRNIKTLSLGITRAIDYQLKLRIWQRLCRWARRLLRLKRKS